MKDQLFVDKHSEVDDVVTIDGPSGAGKSTISRMLAQSIGYTYLDTGAMYRGVALIVERQAIDPHDSVVLEKLLDQMVFDFQDKGDNPLIFVNGEDVTTQIRTPEMSLLASKISALSTVRQKLTGLQQEIGRRGRLVAEGRDMGTVVFPRARHKFYLDADSSERARRRCLQLQEAGKAAEFEEILSQIRKRDADDSKRSLAPLRPADGAVVIDSSSISPAGVIALMKEKILAV